MSTAAARSPDPSTRLGVVAGWVLGAVALGAAGAFLAGRVDPFALPALLALATLGLAAFARPLVGVAAAFPLLVVGNLGLAPGPPWALGAAWCFVLAAVALVAGGGEARAARLPPLTAVLALFFAVSALSAGIAGDPADAAPVLRTVLTGLALFFAISTLVRRPEEVRWPLGGAVVAAGLVALFAAYQWRFGDPLGVGFLTDTGALVYRVSAGFGHPNQLGGFLVIIAPYVLAAAVLIRRARPLLLAVFAVLVFGIYVSFSRGALIALATIPFFFVRKRHILLLAPVLGALVLAFAPGLLRERFGTLSEQGSELSSRVDMWTTAWQVWLANPLFGVGPGGFPDAYAVARVPGKQFLPATMFEAPPHAHNVVLQVLAELGLAGIVSFAAVLAGAAWVALLLRASRSPELRLVGTATLSSLTAFLIHNQFDVTLIETNGIFFWGLLGLAAAGGVLVRPEAGAVELGGRGRMSGLARRFRRGGGGDAPAAADDDLARREAELAWRQRRLEEWQRELAERSRAEAPDATEERTEELRRREEQLARAAAELREREAELERRLGLVTKRELSVARTAARAAAVPPAPPPAEPAPSAREGGIELDGLERIVDRVALEQPERAEELRYYLFYLRDFADLEGRVPATFDGLVDEVFGDLLG